MTPFLDCTVPITTIKPFRGCALVELLAPPAVVNGVALPEPVGARAGMGKVVDEGDKFPGQEALVRKLGEPDPAHPFEVGLGDRVLVKYYSGVCMTQGQRRFKLLKGTEIQAVFV